MLMQVSNKNAGVWLSPLHLIAESQASEGGGSGVGGFS